MTKAEALKKVRELCRALPGTTEKKAWNAPTFRAKGRMYAMFVDHHHGDPRLAVWCKAPPGAQRTAVRDDPDNVFVPPYVGKGGWIGVHLGGSMTWSRVAAFLRQAHAGADVPAGR